MQRNMVQWLWLMIHMQLVLWVKHGKGTHEYNDVMGRVDIITGTLGKALGGASGGYTSGKKRNNRFLKTDVHGHIFFQIQLLLQL